MRVLFALQLSDDLKQELGRVARHIRKAIPYGVAFARLEQIHLTLRFIPEIDKAQVQGLIAAMPSVARELTPFALTLNSCDCFPYHGPLSVIWSTVTEESTEPVSRCHSLTNAMVLAQGLAIEDKPYVPHITLGRIRRGMPEEAIRKAVAGLKVYPVTQTVDAITLFQSDVTIRGAIHTELHTERLGPPSTIIA